VENPWIISFRRFPRVERDSFFTLKVKGKGKGKGHTLDIAQIGEGSSLQKRSGMARVGKGFHSFTCTPTRLSMNLP